MATVAWPTVLTILQISAVARILVESSEMLVKVELPDTDEERVRINTDPDLSGIHIPFARYISAIRVRFDCHDAIFGQVWFQVRGQLFAVKWIVDTLGYWKCNDGKPERACFLGFFDSLCEEFRSISGESRPGDKLVAIIAVATTIIHHVSAYFHDYDEIKPHFQELNLSFVASQVEKVEGIG